MQPPTLLHTPRMWVCQCCIATTSVGVYPYTPCVYPYTPCVPIHPVCALCLFSLVGYGAAPCLLGTCTSVIVVLPYLLTTTRAAVVRLIWRGVHGSYVSTRPCIFFFLFYGFSVACARSFFSVLLPVCWQFFVGVHLCILHPITTTPARGARVCTVLLLLFFGNEQV